MATDDLTCVRALRADSNAADRVTAQEMSIGVAAVILRVIVLVAVLCLLIELGPATYSVLRALFTSAAHRLVVLLQNYWIGLVVCTLSWALAAWAGLVGSALDGHARWRRLLVAVACTATLTYAVSSQALLVLIGDDAGASRWVSMIATQLVGLMACAVGVLAGAGVFKNCPAHDEAQRRDRYRR